MINIVQFVGSLPWSCKKNLVFIIRAKDICKIKKKKPLNKFCICNRHINSKVFSYWELQRLRYLFSQVNSAPCFIRERNGYYSRLKIYEKKI
jgi:hypothetical protein